MRSRDGFMGSKWWERQDGRRRNEMYFLHVPVFFLFTCFLLFLFFLPWNCCFPVRLVFLLPLFYFCMFCMCTSVFCQWDIFTNRLCHFFAPRGPEIHVASGKTTSTITTTIIAPSPCGPEIDVASGFVAVSFGGNI